MILFGRMKRHGRNILVVAAAFLIVFGLFRLTTAGSLTPSAPPASTMHDLEELYAVLVGNFDSSAVVASRQGDVMQVTKCIISKINGSPCP